MRVESLEVRYYEHTLPEPIADARNVIRGRSMLLVFLKTEDGLTGVAEAASFAGSGPLVAAALEHLRPLIATQDVRHVPEVYDTLFRATQHFGRRGVVVSALSAVDVALWDLLGKRAELPLSEILGAHRSSIQYYFNSGYYLPERGPEDCQAALKDAVRQAVERGARATKIKIGRFGLADDKRRIEIARRVLGDDRDLMVDANGVYRERDVLAMDPFLQEHRVRWLEEPVPLTRPSLLGRLAERTRTPIAGYELEMTTDGYGELLDAGAVSVVQPDTIWSGGITECRRVAGLAAYHGVELIPHNFASIVALAANAQLAASAKTGGWLEVDANENPFLHSLLAAPGWALSDGRFEVPRTPGLGVELNLDAVEALRVKL